MNLSINDSTKTVFEIVSNFLAEKKLAIASYDDARPWGGFLYWMKVKPIILLHLSFHILQMPILIFQINSAQKY